ncbi:MAG: HD-GYP domain-containing protein [Permianibacter sp.]
MFLNKKADELIPGMYVVEVVRQSGHMQVTTQGWVRTRAAIDALIARGIQEVLIDPSKTIAGSEAAIQAASEAAATPADSSPADAKSVVTKSAPAQPAAVPAAKVPMETELNRAAKLYAEAKALQQKAFDDIKAGRPLALEPMQNMAAAFMESVFRNQDALLCMTRIREKDAYLLEHSVNVSILMTILARHLKLEETVIHQLATGALLHDVGKILVSDKVLNKPGKLTDEEFIEMRRHVEYGYDVVKHIPGISPISLEVLIQHHERLDGHGYPHKLSGDGISRYGRMIAIVDSYDAITANRVYKDGFTSTHAFKILREASGTSYDTELVAHFIRAIGVFPVGTLVRLKSQRLGIVIQSGDSDPLKPVVKVFYHSKFRQQLPVTDVDLAAPRCEDEIEAAVKPEQFKLDLIGFLRSITGV